MIRREPKIIRTERHASTKNFSLWKSFFEKILALRDFNREEKLLSSSRVVNATRVVQANLGQAAGTSAIRKSLKARGCTAVVSNRARTRQAVEHYLADSASRYMTPVLDLCWLSAGLAAHRSSPRDSEETEQYCFAAQN